jgi:hypothetical protein
MFGQSHSIYTTILLLTFDPSGVGECKPSVLHIRQLPGSHFYYLDFWKHSTSSLKSITLVFTFDPSGVVIQLSGICYKHSIPPGSAECDQSVLHIQQLPGSYFYYLEFCRHSTSSLKSITLVFTFDLSGVVIQLSGICYKHSIPPGSAECKQSVLHIQQLPGSYFYYLEFCRHQRHREYQSLCSSRSTPLGSFLIMWIVL